MVVAPSVRDSSANTTRSANANIAAAMQSRHGSSVVTSVTPRRFACCSATSSGWESRPSRECQKDRATISPSAATTAPIGISPAASESAACSSAAAMSSEELEDTQRPPERRDEIHAGTALARSGDQLPGMSEADVRGVRPGRLERVLQVLRNDDARDLVVQSQRKAVARQWEDAEQHRDRPAAAEPLLKCVDVVEV